MGGPERTPPGRSQRVKRPPPHLAVYQLEGEALEVAQGETTRRRSRRSPTASAPAVLAAPVLVGGVVFLSTPCDSRERKEYQKR